MAPRKKRPAKSAARTARTRSGIKYQAPEKDLKKVASKKSPDVKKTPIIKPPEPIVTRSHKKFGKYRFFAENDSSTPSPSTPNSEEPIDSSNKSLEIEEVLLPELTMENENESPQIQLSDESEEEDSITDPTNDNSIGEESTSLPSETNTEDLEQTEMDCNPTLDPEQTISEQMSNLNVEPVQPNHREEEDNSQLNENIQYVTEPEKGDMEIYHVDNFESEIIIDCFPEEVIPICGEQEVINENDDSNLQVTMKQAIESKQKTEELTAILEESKTESEEIIERKESNTEDIVSILEGNDEDSKEIEILEIPEIKHDNDDEMKLKEDLVSEDIIKEENLIPLPLNTNQDLSDISEMKKELPKLNKTKGKISKKKIISEKNSEDSSKPSESSVRRSSRIKSISVLKQKCSKGHGLVKQKGESSMKNIDSENGDSNNSTSDTQSTKSNQKTTVGQVISLPDHKPVKVKSRWRRSSELELNNTTSQTLNKLYLASVITSQSDSAPTALSEEAAARRDSEEVAKRLKQFVHLKENLYLTERISCKEARKMVCDCFLTEDDIQQGEYGCGEDCLNRLLMIECGAPCAVGDRCTNKRFQKGQFAPCEVFRTDKKGLGIRAAANIPYGEFILEYVGEVLDPEEFEKRAAEYSKDKNQHYYFMSLRADAVIDATRKGNVSRFINHSCDPNAETQKWTVNGELRIGFFSKRTILAGEEITFDYQFQRYGKEAQKCFCEAPTCRGWLGEEPDDEDDEDEDDDEEDEEEEEEDEEEGNRKAEVQETVKDTSQVISTSESIENREKLDSVKPPSVKPEKPVKKEKKRALRQRLPRKELFEDLDLDDEIETLQTTGLKNQAHTLKLSRLMVRAKEPAQRTKLLRVLRRGEFPCRRLFLDYHGLRLIHGWMTDAQHLCRINKKFESLRLEILQTLATLPIPNKTMLQDSKVLPTVEKWSIKLEQEVSPIDSDSNSPKIESDTLTPTGNSTQIQKSEISESASNKKLEQILSSDTYQEDMDISPVAFDSKETNVKNITEATLPPSDLSDNHYETEIIALALKLLEEWSVLKEVFRIPKKERIEQMKEHEREADRKYKAGLGLDGQDPFMEKKDLSRYSLLARRQKKKKRRSSHSDKDSSYIDKYERRKLFALQVEQREMERRRNQREFWRQHEQRCVVMGADPRFTAPFEPNQGYQCVWNPQTGQWQNYPLPGNQNYNPNLPPHHQPQYTSIAHIGANQPQMVPPSMLPAMQQNQSMMKHLQQPVGLPPPLHQKSPMGYNIQSLPLHQSNPSQHQYNVRAPPPNMGVLPNMGLMSNPAPSPQHIHQQQQQPRGLIGYPPGVPEMMQPQQAPYHLSVDSQNPPSTQNLMHVSSLQSGVHNKPPPLLPALPYQDSIKGQDEVRFMGPIPPPARLPPKWKCAKDKYNRPYYYHIRIRRPQWEPPDLPPEENEELSESTSSSETSSMTSDSSTEETDSDDDIDDAKLLLQIKNKFKQMDALKNAEKATGETKENAGADEDEDKGDEGKERSLDDRLIEEFCFMKGSSTSHAKRKRTGLVQEILISPRTEEDRLQFKEDMKRYKQNKEKLKRQKELLLEQSKKHNTPVKPSKSVAASKPPKTSKKHKISVKTKIKEMADNETAKKIKEAFRSSMAVVMVSILNTYRKPDCKEGRITNTEDFKHLARKLTHFVMLKELKHCQNIEDLTCTESVKSKAREFVRKYMSKFGEIYVKPKDEAEFY